MGIWKKAVLFYLGGAGYMTLEFLWRGRSHGSMFLLGGAGFLLLGPLGRGVRPWPWKALLGAASVTGLELLTGLAINRDHGIWDYRGLPLQYRGQICLPYSLLWIPVSLGAMALYDRAERLLPSEKEQ